MKPAGWAILILSLLLVVVSAVLIGVIGTADKRVKDAAEQVQSAVEATKTVQSLLDAEKTNSTQMKKERDDQVRLLADARATIKKLSEAQGGAAGAVEVAVKEGDDLKTAFDAGAPLIESFGPGPLISWYGEVEMRINPLLGTILDLRYQIAGMRPYIAELEHQNADLTASNFNLSGLIAERDDHITELEGVNAGLKDSLQKARDDLTGIVNANLFRDIVMYTLIAVVAGETIYIVGNDMLKWW